MFIVRLLFKLARFIRNEYIQFKKRRFMSRVCDVTGKKPMFGNNVSHANNKSRRRFNINLQKKKFWLPDEKRYVTLRLSTRGMRVIDKKGIRRVVNELRAKGIKV